MSPSHHWPDYDLDIRGGGLDLLYLSFLFIGVLEAGPPLSEVPVGGTILTGIALSIGVVLYLPARSTVVFSRKSAITQLLLFLLLGWLTISLLWAPSYIGARVMINSIIGLAIAFSYPIWVIGPDRGRIARLLWFIAGFGILLALLFLIRGQVPSMVPNRISLSRPIGLAVVILTARAMTDNSRSAIGWYSAVLVLIIVLFQTGARGPAGSAVIASGVIVSWILVDQREFSLSDKVSRGIPVMAFIGLISIILIAVQMESLATIDRFTALFDGPGKSVTNRLDMYSWAVKSWLSSPQSILIGQGMGAFSENYGAGYPHNIFIELVHAGGIIAVLLFGGFLLTAMQGIASNENFLRAEYFALVGLLIYMLLNAQVTGNIYINKYLFLVLGLLVAWNTGIYSNMKSYEEPV